MTRLTAQATPAQLSVGGCGGLSVSVPARRQTELLLGRSRSRSAGMAAATRSKPPSGAFSLGYQKLGAGALERCGRRPRMAADGWSRRCSRRRMTPTFGARPPREVGHGEGPIPQPRNSRFHSCSQFGGWGGTSSAPSAPPHSASRPVPSRAICTSECPYRCRLQPGLTPDARVSGLLRGLHPKAARPQVRGPWQAQARAHTYTRTRMHAYMHMHTCTSSERRIVCPLG
jgi:hypothetical protein